MMPPVPLFDALADPTRCRIIEILHRGPQPVHLLAASFSISRPAISRHLRVLKEARLISEKKTGRENVYALHVDKLSPAVKWLQTMLPVAPVKQVQLKAAPAKTPRPKPVAKVMAPRTAVSPTSPRPAAVSQMGFDF